MPHKPKGGFTHGGPRPGARAPKTVIKLKKGQMLELMQLVALNGNGGEVAYQTFTIVYIEEDAIWLRKGINGVLQWARLVEHTGRASQKSRKNAQQDNDDL